MYITYEARVSHEYSTKRIIYSRNFVVSTLIFIHETLHIAYYKEM